MSFRYKVEKMNTTIKFSKYKLVKKNKFQLKQTVLIFRTKFLQKGYYRKVNISFILEFSQFKDF